MTTEMMAMDEFDVLLNDVLRTVANPEVPERVQVRTRVWVREMSKPTSQKRDMGHPIAVFAPEVFLAKMQPRRDARSTAAAALVHVAAIALLFVHKAGSVERQRKPRPTPSNLYVSWVYSIDV